MGELEKSINFEQKFTDGKRRTSRKTTRDVCVELVLAETLEMGGPWNAWFRLVQDQPNSEIPNRPSRQLGEPTSRYRPDTGSLT